MLDCIKEVENTTYYDPAFCHLWLFGGVSKLEACKTSGLVEKIENEFGALSSQEVQPKEEPKAARSRAKK